MFNIAIDGPAGAGKSTIAKAVAKKLGFIYVDTGALYRSIALYFIRNGIKPDETERIGEECKKIDIMIQYVEGEQQVLLNGENVTPYIRSEEVGNMASAIAALPQVREALLQLQRGLAKKADIIMDGRDIGTCVLPDAPLKIYLTASAKERAKRRYMELIEKGMSCSIDEIEADIIDRDNRDMNREIAPLKQAEDAILVDSSNLGIDEVIEAIIAQYHKTMEYL